jgi:hypothetical protein
MYKIQQNLGYVNLNPPPPHPLAITEDGLQVPNRRCFWKEKLLTNCFKCERFRVRAPSRTSIVARQYGRNYRYIQVPLMTLIYFGGNNKPSLSVCMCYALLVYLRSSCTAQLFVYFMNCARLLRVSWTTQWCCLVHELRKIELLSACTAQYVKLGSCPQFANCAVHKLSKQTPALGRCGYKIKGPSCLEPQELYFSSSFLSCSLYLFPIFQFSAFRIF